jgi:hypothetical protein
MQIMAQNILPPNHPDRPEWGILTRLTRREQPLYRRGMTVEDASATMKGALEQAWLERPREVLAACDGKRLAMLAKENAKRPSEFQKTIDFIQERLWLNTADGAEPRALDPGRGSSAYGIRYWNPEAGGLASYMKARVGWILNDYAELKSVEGQTTSLDKLTEGGLEIATDRTFVRPLRSSSTEIDHDAGEGSDEPPEPAASVPDLAKSAQSSTPDVDAVVYGPEKDSTEGEVLAAANRQRLEAFSRQHSILTSPNRGEFGFFATALGRVIEPASAPEDRFEQLKELAYEVLETVGKDLPDRNDVVEDLKSWTPDSRSFFQSFPDVTEFVIDTLARPELWGGPEPVTRDAADVSRLLGLTPPEMRSPGQLDLAASAFESVTEAHRVLRVSDMWNATATPEMLNSPERPDYQFLCEVTKTPIDESLSPQELHASLKTLAHKWNEQACSNDTLRSLLDISINKWDPGVDGYLGEVVMSRLSEIVQSEASVGEVTDDQPEALEVFRRHPGKTSADITRQQLAEINAPDNQLGLFRETPGLGD